LASAWPSAGRGNLTLALCPRSSPSSFIPFRQYALAYRLPRRARGRLPQLGSRRHAAICHRAKPAAAAIQHQLYGAGSSSLGRLCVHCAPRRQPGGSVHHGLADAVGRVHRTAGARHERQHGRLQLAATDAAGPHCADLVGWVCVREWLRVGSGAHDGPGFQRGRHAGPGERQ